MMPPGLTLTLAWKRSWFIAFSISFSREANRIENKKEIRKNDSVQGRFPTRITGRHAVRQAVPSRDIWDGILRSIAVVGNPYSSPFEYGYLLLEILRILSVNLYSRN